MISDKCFCFVHCIVVTSSLVQVSPLYHLCRLKFQCKGGLCTSSFLHRTCVRKKLYQQLDKTTVFLSNYKCISEFLNVKFFDYVLKYYPHLPFPSGSPLLQYVRVTFGKLWISTYLLEEGLPTNKQCKWNIIFS